MSLQDLIAVRIALEDLIAELAIEKITPEELDQLQRAIEEAEGLLDESVKKQGGNLDAELLSGDERRLSHAPGKGDKESAP